MNICIYGSASNEIDRSYIDTVENLGKALAKRGHSLVFGGGANGLMGAAARGFHSENAKIIGVVPRFFNVDGILFEKGELIRTDTMRERKQIMDDLAEAFIATPGGIGTFEEFFEIYTLKQLGQSKKPLVIFDINGYYKPLIAMLENGINGSFMPKQSMSLFHYTDSIEDAIDYIENYTGPDFDINAVRTITKA
jgi:uncharacterized protein (TIGR00730 family)